MGAMRHSEPEKRKELLLHCFDCFCENGIEGTSTQKPAKACGMSSGNIFHYFKTKDEIIVESTEYAMAQVEREFMEPAPRDISQLEKFLKEVPYWTAQRHGAKYRFMYQVYTSPKYRAYGKKFFDGARERYTAYAKQLEPQPEIPWQVVRSLICFFVRASVHYALFEDEDYLKQQICFFDEVLPLLEEDAKNGRVRQEPASA